ncbi:MAG: TonB-dependent receptor [Erythrobacter sp.]|nr:TonB-dependent receptor [Erythrobacter sp.]
MMRLHNSAQHSKSALYAGAGALAVAMSAFAAPAYAQETEEVGTEVAERAIVVTGSRISNPNLELSSPVSVVGAEEFAIQQVLSVEEVLREIPGSAPGIGSQVGNGGNGAATINLRGLGSNRNLVLIDGNRLVPATLAAVVDTNIIPISLLQRVDVFTGGASTAYGADAVVGVVNFVTKDNFSGVEVNATYGITEMGDAGQYRLDLTVGGNFADGRGNAVLTVGFTDADPLFQGQRDFSRVGLSGTTGNPQGSTTSIPVTFRTPIVGQLDVPTGIVGLNPANTFNFSPDNAFRTPLRRFSLYGKTSYDITDNIEAFSSALFSKSTVGFPAASTGLFANPVFLPLSNPFLPAATRNQLCAADSNATLPGVQPFLSQADCDAAALATSPTDPNYREINIVAERRFTELGPRFTEWTTTTFQFNGGLRGALTDNIDWLVSGSYGESERITESRSAGTAALQQALRATNPNTCTVTTGGCVPLNLFGPEGSITPAMADFLRLTTFNFVKTSFTSLEGGLSGDLGVTSPFASTPIGFAVGVEYREYTGESFGDAISRQPGAVLGAGAAALPIAGSYDSREVYAELIVPLVEDKPFIQSLTFEGGIRFSDYSTSGGNTTWKAGGSWEPVDGVKFRGMYSRAVRAPNIGELFQPQVVALSNLTFDPCQGQITNSAGANFNAGLANSAPLQALCIATGVPAGALGSGSIPAPSAGQIQTTQGGNPLLDPEVATTITGGVVVQPNFLPGLSISADWYRILVKDAITNPTVLDVVNGCYSATLNPTLSATTPACLSIGRNPAGRLDGAAVETPGVLLALSNQGRIETSGIDVNVNYTRDIGFATFVYALAANYTFENLFQATPVSINRECIGFFSTSCDPISDFTLNQRTTLRFDAIDVSLNWRHLSSVKREPLASAILPAFSVIPSYNLFDLGVAVNASDNIRLNLAVSNLFDKAPPLVGNQVGTTAFNAGNTFPSTYDVFGRRYNIGVNLRF